MIRQRRRVTFSRASSARSSRSSRGTAVPHLCLVCLAGSRAGAEFTGTARFGSAPAGASSAALGEGKRRSTGKHVPLSGRPDVPALGLGSRKRCGAAVGKAAPHR